MPIEVKCDSCGKTLKAPDTMAGKRAKCPGCGSVLVVPAVEEVFDAEVVEPAPPSSGGLGDLLDDELGYRVAEPEAMVDVPSESRRPCPACGEMIPTAAAKCRFCDEIFDAALKKKSKKKKGSFGLEESDDNPNVGEWLIAVFCGLIGIVIALVYVAQGKKKGWKMLAAAAILFGVFFVIGFVQALMEQQ